MKLFLYLFEKAYILWVFINNSILKIIEYLLLKYKKNFIFKVILGVPLLWILFAISIAYLVPLVSPVISNNQVELWKTAELRALPVQVSDRENRYIGFLSSHAENDFLPEIKINNKIVTEPIYVRPNGTRYNIWRDHKSINLEKSPEAFWLCLKYLEDQHIGTWRNPYGVDFLSVLKMPLTGRGGSTISMQLVRSLNKDYAWSLPNNPSIKDRLNKRIDDVGRKFNELYWAPVLNNWLTGINGEDEIARWAANHVALIQGGYRYDVVGVGAASRVLFGKNAYQLSIAEQYLLAAAVIQPLRFSYEVDGRVVVNSDAIRKLIVGTSQHSERSDSDLDSSIWNGRAIRCANNKDITPSNIKDKIVNNLISLVNNNIKVYIDKDIENALIEGGFSYDVELVNPERAANLMLMGGVKHAIYGEIRNRYGADYRKNINQLNITLDISKNIEFINKLYREIANLEGSNYWCDGHKNGVYILYEKACGKEKNTESKRVPFLLAVANKRGEIVRFFSTDIFSNYFGANSYRYQGGLGGYNYLLEQREVASIAKIAAALLLADGGNERLDRKYSNRCVNELTSSWCFDRSTSAPEHVFPEIAFGRSLNDPLINRLIEKRILGSKIDQFMNALNFNSPIAHKAVPGQTKITLGRYAGSPQVVHGLIRYALAYATAENGANLKPTTMIVEIDSRPSQLKEVVGYSKEVIKDNSLISGGGRTYLKKVLEAPICISGGTLNKLRKWCSTNNHKIDIHIAKTGTRSNSLDYYTDYDWWIVGAIKFKDNREYSYVVRLGWGNPSDTFYANGGAGKLYKIIDLLLEDIEQP